MNEPLYTRDILRLAASIPNLVRFADLEGAAERRSPTCGSRARVAVEVDEAGRIVAVRQAVEACAFGQASAALMGRAVEGRNSSEILTALAGIENWLEGDDASALAWPGLDILAPARGRRSRHGAILLPFRTLLAALEEGR